MLAHNGFIAMNSANLPVSAAGLRLKRVFCSLRVRVEPPSSPLPSFPRSGQQVFRGVPPKSKFLAILAASLFRRGGPLVAAVLGLGSLHAAPGDLDPSFGEAGVAELAFPFSLDTVSAVAAQADGKLVLAGAADDRLFLLRLQEDGSLDASFGEGGKVIANLEADVSGQQVSRMRVQPADGKIVVAGRSSNFILDDFRPLLMRFLPDGTLDEDFGEGGVVMPGDYRSWLAGLQVLADGKILVVGRELGAPGPSGVVGWDLVLGRYLPDGTPDADFGTGGFVRHAGLGDPVDLALSSSGKWLVVTDRAELHRFQADGSPDQSFGEMGTAAVPLESATSLAVVPYHLAALQPERIIVGGTRQNASGRPDMAVAVFTEAGTVDPEGGGPGVEAGVVVLDTEALNPWFDGQSSQSFHAEVTSLVVQPGGLPVASTPRVYAVGTSRVEYRHAGSSTPYAVHCVAQMAKLHGGGAPDASFGANGLAAYGSGQLFAALLRSGRLVLAGHTGGGSGGDALAMRVQAAGGAPDSSFGSGGRVEHDVTTSHLPASMVMAAQPDGKVLAAAAMRVDYERYAVAVTRLLPDGATDPQFGAEGSTGLDWPGSHAPERLALQADGKILLAGRTRPNPASDETYTWLVRLRADGSLDPDFGTDGRVLPTPYGDDEHGAALVVQPDGGILMSRLSITTGPPSRYCLHFSRFTAGGQPDASFGIDGAVLYQIGYMDQPAGSSADPWLQPDGKIIFTFSRIVPDPNFPQFFPNHYLVETKVARLHPDGLSDDSFGEAGEFTWVGNGGYITSMILAHDGKIIFTMVAFGHEVRVMRLLASGELDTDFADNSFSSIGVISYFDRAISRLLPDGKVFIACGGYDYYDRPMLCRLLPDGGRDASFGQDGRIFVDIRGRPGVIDGAGRVLAHRNHRVARILTESAVIASELSILSITRLGNGHIQLQGTGAPGVAHTLHASPSLLPASFTPLSPITPDATGHWHYNDTTTSGVPRRFYRLSGP